MAGQITLLHCDCMDFMREQPDKAFDLAIVDPNYRDENEPTKDMRSNGPMESLKGRPKKEYWSELTRVSKERIIWGANNFQLPQWKGFVVWKKKTISEEFTMSMCEVASLSEGLGTTSKWFESPPQDKFRIHPTQKPVRLYQWLLTNYAKPGQRIFDSHLGSASSAIAAHYFGVDFVGCEIDKHYYDLAVERLERETAQIDMFQADSRRVIDTDYPVLSG